MKINKITLFICTVLTIISGLAIILVDSIVPDSVDTSLYQSVASGIFTGFIVSLVISGYRLFS